MEHLLSQQLASIGEDTQLRKANLRNLVSSLTSHECRDLAAQLSTVDYRTDIVTRIPVELLFIIAEYIDGRELFHFLNVSKQWRAAWLEKSVLQRLAKKWFPGFLEYVSIQEQLTGVPQDIERLFLDAARKYHFRSLGKFRSAFYANCWLPSIHGADQEQHFTLDRTHQHCDSTWEAEYPHLFNSDTGSEFRAGNHHYAHGRLAWQPCVNMGRQEDSLVFVDDLRTQQRKLYRVPMLPMLGERAILVALGDRLVVVAVDRRIFAWRLETIELQQATLPNRPVSVATMRDTIAIATGPDAVIVWRFGHQIRAVDMSELNARPPSFIGEHHRRQCLLFFDPLREQTFYKASLLGSYPSNEAVVVDEFTNGQYTKSFHLQLSEIPGFPEGSSPWLPNTCERAGSYGDFQIMVVPSKRRQYHIRDRPSHVGVATHEVIQIIFNVFNRSFSVRHGSALFEYEKYHSLLVPSCGWNDHATYFASSAESGSNSNTKPLLIAKPYLDRPRARSSIPGIYTFTPRQSEDGRGFVNRRRRIDDDREIDSVSKNWDFEGITRRAVNNEGDESAPVIVGKRLELAMHAESSYVLDGPRKASTFASNNARVFEDDDFIILADWDWCLIWSFRTDIARGTSLRTGTGAK